MFKLIRRLTQCNRGIHWRMKYDIGRAGTCSDCGHRSEGIEMSKMPKMPDVKPPMSQTEKDIEFDRRCRETLNKLSWPGMW